MSTSWMHRSAWHLCLAVYRRIPMATLHMLSIFEVIPSHSLRPACLSLSWQIWQEDRFAENVDNYDEPGQSVSLLSWTSCSSSIIQVYHWAFFHSHVALDCQVWDVEIKDRHNADQMRFSYVAIFIFAQASCYTMNPVAVTYNLNLYNLQDLNSKAHCVQWVSRVLNAFCKAWTCRLSISDTAYS